MKGTCVIASDSTVSCSVLAAAAVAVSVGLALMGQFRPMVLEAPLNPHLTTAESEKDLDSYFGSAGLTAQPRVRASSVEARQSLRSWEDSLDSPGNLGPQFCKQHPMRCHGYAVEDSAQAYSQSMSDAHTSSHGTQSLKLRPVLKAAGKPRGQMLPQQHQRGARQVLKSKAQGFRAQKMLPIFADALNPGSSAPPASAARALVGWGGLNKQDEAELAACNVPPPRPKYCRLLKDIGMDMASIKVAAPTRKESQYRYRAHHGGYTTPMHVSVPIMMKHGNGNDLGDNMVMYGAPDRLIPEAEQNEEGNLLPLNDAPGVLGKVTLRGGPLSPLLRRNAERVPAVPKEQRPVGMHYSKYNERVGKLDTATSDGVMYGALPAFKTLGLALADDYVSPNADAENREKEYGHHPAYFTERFRPFAQYDNLKDWHDAVATNSTEEWSMDDAAALPEFNREPSDQSDEFGGRSGVEQRVLYGDDFFNFGHTVPEDGANTDFGFGDLRLKGNGDGAEMPAFPRDTNAMLKHPWTDQAHVFYDEYGAKDGGIVDTGRSHSTV